jgi:hypothetical protein
MCDIVQMDFVQMDFVQMDFVQMDFVQMDFVQMDCRSFCIICTSRFLDKKSLE